MVCVSIGYIIHHTLMSDDLPRTVSIKSKALQSSMVPEYEVDLHLLFQEFERG